MVSSNPVPSGTAQLNLLMLSLDDGIFEMSGITIGLNFMDIFYNDDIIISVTCVASNDFGDVNATTLISVCGTTKLKININFACACTVPLVPICAWLLIYCMLSHFSYSCTEFLLINLP